MPVEKRKNPGAGSVSITDFFQSVKEHEKGGAKKRKVEITVEEKKVERWREQKAVENSHGDKRPVDTEAVEVETVNTIGSKIENKVDIKTELDELSAGEEDEEYAEICTKYNFNKQEWIQSLSSQQRELLSLEIKHLHISWLAPLHKTLTKPYFLKLKQFVLSEQSSKTIFPPAGHIYTWSHLTPLTNINCLVLGQDPYHNFNQAHGLSFSVIEPTKPPPSLVNIYKALAIDFQAFKIPDYKQLQKEGKPGGGNLTSWAKQGVLMLNTCLTVEAHKPNSHAKRGWEEFTEEVLRVALSYSKQKGGFVIMGWGSPAQKRIEKIGFNSKSFLILNTVHPLPLSAHRGFFESKVFYKCNKWLKENNKKPIDWAILPGNSII